MLSLANIVVLLHLALVLLAGYPSPRDIRLAQQAIVLANQSLSAHAEFGTPTYFQFTIPSSTDENAINVTITP